MIASQSAAFLDTCTDLLGQGRRVRFRAAGPSMEPTIRNGEVIIVSPAAASGLRRGDIAFYRTERGLIAHRVVGLVSSNPRVFRVRGDAPGCSDESVGEQQILGQVVAVERSERVLTLPRNTFFRRCRRWTERSKRIPAVLPNLLAVMSFKLSAEKRESRGNHGSPQEANP
jgi:hypothetical protein